jgi:hypothetical protein
MTTAIFHDRPAALDVAERRLARAPALLTREQAKRVAAAFLPSDPESRTALVGVALIALLAKPGDQLLRDVRHGPYRSACQLLVEAMRDYLGRLHHLAGLLEEADARATVALAVAPARPVAIRVREEDVCAH